MKAHLEPAALRNPKPPASHLAAMKSDGTYNAP